MGWRWHGQHYYISVLLFQSQSQTPPSLPYISMLPLTWCASSKNRGGTTGKQCKNIWTYKFVFGVHSRCCILCWIIIMAKLNNTVLKLIFILDTIKIYHGLCFSRTLFSNDKFKTYFVNINIIPIVLIWTFIDNHPTHCTIHIISVYPGNYMIPSSLDKNVVVLLYFNCYYTHMFVSIEKFSTCTYQILR